MSLIVPASGRGNACSTSSANLPRYAPMRSTSPSTRHTAGSPAPNSRAQLSRILSKTGFGSAIDPLITCSTSADAVCRSSASDVSLKRRAFCSATAACSDSPTRNSSSCGSNGLPPVRHTAIAPCTWSKETSGTTIIRSSRCGSVPGICTARGSDCVSLMSSGCPLCSSLPMMPSPATIDVALISSADVPSATIAR